MIGLLSGHATTQSALPRVNLLPPELAERARQRRITTAGAGVLAAYVLLLGALYLAKVGAVDDARQQRDTAVAEVAALQRQQVALAEYGQLQTELEQRDTLLTGAMGQEAAVARVLTDLAMSFPATASLRTLNLVLTPAAAAPVAAAPVAAAPVAAAPVGQIAFGGYSVDQLAPGVQQVLLGVRGGIFGEPFVQVAQDEAVGTAEVVGFTGSVDLGDGVRTGRYAQGLPPVEVAP